MGNPLRGPLDCSTLQDVWAKGSARVHAGVPSGTICRGQATRGLPKPHESKDPRVSTPKYPTSRSWEKRAGFNRLDPREGAKILLGKGRVDKVEEGSTRGLCQPGGTRNRLFPLGLPEENTKTTFEGGRIAWVGGKLVGVFK